jgi:hypothetical protein
VSRRGLALCQNCVLRFASMVFSDVISQSVVEVVDQLVNKLLVLAGTEIVVEGS